MHVKVVWITMLALADRKGIVFASLPGLADAARVSMEQCEDAIARLAAPDEYSRTKDFEGRRIEDVDGGWKLLNYIKYREARDGDERREQVREAVNRHRTKRRKGELSDKQRAYLISRGSRWIEEHRDMYVGGNGKTFDAAFEQAIGMPYSEFEKIKGIG